MFSQAIFHDKNIVLSEKGYELVNFCEFDKFAIKSYCAIHDIDENRNLGDITKVDENNLAEFNMICGGSPCQDFSIAGKQKVVDGIAMIAIQITIHLPFISQKEINVLNVEVIILIKHDHHYLQNGCVL